MAIELPEMPPDLPPPERTHPESLGYRINPASYEARQDGIEHILRGTPEDPISIPNGGVRTSTTARQESRPKRPKIGHRRALTSP